MSKKKELKEKFEEYARFLFKFPMVCLFGEETAEYLWKTMQESKNQLHINSLSDFYSGYSLAIVDVFSPKNEKFESMLEVRNKSKEKQND